MQRSTVLTAFQRAAALFLAASMVPAAWAQDAPQVPSAPSAQMPAQQAVPSKSQPFDVKEYSKPRSAFPNLLAPYTARHVAPPNVANTPRIDQLLHDGKLYISMNDAVALALENNLDIAIARYNLNIADTDIWRAKAGSSILGVNSGVVQNTPGGGIGGLGTQVGSGQGGTSVAAGGAGTGTGGLVVSTLGNGPLIASFDPILTGTFQLDQNRTQTVSPFAPPFSDSHTSTWDFGYQEGFQWGTNLSVGFNNTRGTASPGGEFCDRVQDSHRKLDTGAQRYSAGFDPGAGGDRGRPRIPRTQVGARQDLSLSHSPWSDLSAVSGAVCVALPLSARGIGDGCSRPRGCGRARFHVVRGGGCGAGRTDRCWRRCSHD